MADTIASVLEQARSLESVSDSWRLDAELLLTHVLACRRETLLMYPERELSSEQSQRYQELLTRRQQHEPVAYLLGHKEFWDFDLHVTPAVLIPRPETELLVELALSKLAGKQHLALRLADLGTGSGAIALALARSSANWRVHASDISQAALAVAQANAQRLEVSNIEFSLGSWCDALHVSGFDLIVSNPPYVADGDAHLQADGLPFEPAQALTAGADGLDALRQIISSSPARLNTDAWLLLEHGYDQAAAVQELLTAAGFSAVFTAQDLGGQDRVTGGQLSMS